MMSAPCEKGWVRYGVLNVESTMSGMFFACAIADTASRSTISSAGLDTVSQNTARVLSSMALAKFSGSSASTNLTVMPRVGRMSLNCVYVPPYSLLEETMLSPACARLIME